MNKQINLSERDKKLLLFLFFLLMIAASYFFVYQPTTKKANTLYKNNNQLKNQLSELTILEEQSAANTVKIKAFHDKTEKIKAKFPAGLNIEDTIIMVDGLEKASGITISSLGFKMNEVFYPTSANFSNNGQVSGNAASSQTAGTTANASASTTTANSSTSTPTSNSSADTAMSNSPADTTVSATANAPASTSNAGAAGETNATAIGTNLTGYKSSITIAYKSTYTGLKKAINFINHNPSRMTLDNMTAVYDNSTGNLSGNIAINMFSLVDKNKLYVEPFINNIRTGRSNLFGTVEKQK